MKILWLSHLIPYPPKGGVLQRSHYMVRELSKYHQVDLLAFNQLDLFSPLFSSLEEGLAEADEILGEICRRHQFFALPTDSSAIKKYWVALKSLTGSPYNINWLKSQEYASVLKVWLRDTQYDLIHFDTISLLPYFNLVPNDTATVLDHHNIESHMLLRRAENQKNSIKRYYFHQEGLRLQQYEKQYCPKFSLNITCSDIDTERLREIVPTAKVKTIPNGVDIDYFSPEAKAATRNRLIFIGTLNWYPNIEAVLYIAQKLWPRLKQLHSDLEFDIIGANPPEQILKLARSDPSFRVHGFVNDIRPLLNEAAVYVCPINDGGGTKLKILDAMSMAKAIVAHRIACEGIDVSDGHDVLFAETDEEYLEKINFLLASPDARRQLGENARQLMKKKYSYFSIGRELADTFSSIRGE